MNGKALSLLAILHAVLILGLVPACVTNQEADGRSRSSAENEFDRCMADRLQDYLASKV